MSREIVSAAEAVEKLYRIACKQVSRAESGRWEEVHQLMSERVPLVRRLGDARPAALRPLRSLCLQIERMNEKLEDMIGEEQEKTLLVLSELRRAERSIGAYATSWIPRSPEHLDERK